MDQRMREPYVVMVAPNGALRTKADHPALPMTQAEIVEAVGKAHTAGAHAAHLHVRDDDGGHVLDADRYLRLIDALRIRCGDDLVIQITTEAVGRYTPAEQRSLVETVKPQAVSVALRELFADAAETQINTDFLAWAAAEKIAIQWILYAPDEIATLAGLVAAGTLSTQSALLFVLGRYTEGQQSSPSDIIPFLEARKQHSCVQNSMWSVCAFGSGETACLTTALALGGDVRIGFENSLWHADGIVAADNAERVVALIDIVERMGFRPATSEQTRDRLNVQRP